MRSVGWETGNTTFIWVSLSPSILVLRGGTYVDMAISSSSQSISNEPDNKTIDMSHYTLEMSHLDLILLLQAVTNLHVSGIQDPLVSEEMFIKRGE